MILAAAALAVAIWAAWSQHRQGSAAERANRDNRNANKVATDRADEAIRVAEEANRIAHEALEHQRAQGTVRLEIEPSVGFPLPGAPMREKRYPLNCHVEAIVKNVGAVEARVNSAHLVTAAWSIVAESVDGDFVEQSARGAFPFTLMPGCSCQIRFHGWSRSSAGDHVAAPPDFWSGRSAWTTLSHIVVDASHATFTSEDNSRLARFSKDIERAVNEEEPPEEPSEGASSSLDWISQELDDERPPREAKDRSEPKKR